MKVDTVVVEGCSVRYVVDTELAVLEQLECMVSGPVVVVMERLEQGHAELEEQALAVWVVERVQHDELAQALAMLADALVETVCAVLGGGVGPVALGAAEHIAQQELVLLAPSVVGTLLLL